MPDDRPSIIHRGSFEYKLPAGPPRRKYVALREAAQAWSAIHSDLIARRQPAIEELRKHEAYLRQCTDSSWQPVPVRLDLPATNWMGGSSGVKHYSPPTADRNRAIADAETAVAAAREVVERIDQRIAEHGSRSVIAVCSKIDAWLRDSVPVGTLLEPAQPPPGKLPRPSPEAVQTTRAQLTALQQDLAAVRAAPAPASAVKAQITREVERLVAAPTIHTSPDATPRLSLGMVMESLQGMGAIAAPDGGVQQVNVVSTLRQTNALGLMLWLFKDSVVAALNAEVDRQLNGADTIDDATRAKREGDLLAAIFDAELREEALITALEAAGTVVARRDQADPCAILGVRQPNNMKVAA